MNILPFIYFALYPRFFQTFSLSMELAKSYKVSLQLLTPKIEADEELSRFVVGFWTG